MKIARYMFFILAMLTAGSMGSALHAMLSDDAQPSAQVVARAAKTPMGIFADKRDPAPIEFYFDGRPAPADLALTITIKLSNDPVPSTKPVPRTDVDERSPQAEIYAAESQIKASPPSLILSPPGARICSTNQLSETGAWPTDRTPQIIIASEGSIVFVGPNGSLTANTGLTSASGSVALGVQGSALTTGSSTMPVANVDHEERGLPEAPASLDLTWFQGSRGDSADARPSRGLARPDMDKRRFINAGPQANTSFLGLFPGGGGIAISGFEDHSISVVGDDQIVTYDDSNVVIQRNGPVNANTGDTDSSGLNAVDVTNSRVRSGNSGDAEGNEGDDDEDKKKPKKAQDEGPTGQGEPAGATPVAGTPVTMETSKTSEDDSEEPDDEKISFPVAQNGRSFATVADEGTSAALGQNTFVVGADGFDDVSIRSTGNRHLVTYDDSNVIIGGTGQVNAQIGDSDTGGAVVMSVHNSDIEAGCEGDLCYSDVALRSAP